MIHPSHVVMSIVSAMFSLLLALAFAAAGVPLALWAAGATWRAETAREWAVWFLERSPLPLYAAPSQVANDALQRDSLIAASLAAALLCLMAFSLLRSAQRSLRRADESHDGRATIHLTSQSLRVGRPVEGSIWLARGSQNGGMYHLELSCSRGHGPRRSDHTETAYFEELEVAPVATPVGWSLPFRFVVPAIAPPSGVSRFMSGPGYRWHLTFRRAGGWMSPSVFALDLDPAPAEELREIERRERREPELRQATPTAASARPAARAPAHELANEQQPFASASVYEAARAHDTIAHNRFAGASQGARPHARARTAGATAPPREPSIGRSPPAPGFVGASRAAGSQSTAGPAPAPRRAPDSVGNVTPGDARAHDTLVRNRPADAPRDARPGPSYETARPADATAASPDRATRQQPSLSAFEAAHAGSQSDYGTAPGTRNDPRLHERPEFQDLPGYEEEVARTSSVVVRVVKWLFLALFGGALAVSAVALVTAVLLGYVL
jgi:hypothetical protein